MVLLSWGLGVRKEEVLVGLLVGMLGERMDGGGRRVCRVCDGLC